MQITRLRYMTTSISNNGDSKISHFLNTTTTIRRKRPWYVAAKKAGRQTWPDSFVFWGTDSK